MGIHLEIQVSVCPDCCEQKHYWATYINFITNGNGGVTIECFPANITGENGKFLYPAGVIILVLSTLFLIVELLQVHQLRVFYFLEWENYLQLFVFVGAIVFVSALFDASTSRCWCASEGIWQLGAAVVMCCWFNFILMLKDYPFYNIGGHITLLFNICKRYLKLVYLPILLMASFGFSFYMLYVVSEVHTFYNNN